MKQTLLALVVCLFLAEVAIGQNPLERKIGPDGKPLVKAADPAPAPDPSPVPVVAVQSWTEFLVALTAALAAIGALIQGLRNGAKSQANAEKIEAVHETVKALPTAAWRGTIAVPHDLEGK